MGPRAVLEARGGGDCSNHPGEPLESIHQVRGEAPFSDRQTVRE